MKAAAIQNSFSAGEWSPLAQARIDNDRYKEALGKCQNYVPIFQGPIIRRPGTKFVAAAKYDNKATRLVKFEFSVTQAYVLEFTDQYLRFYMNEGQILSAGVPYEISTPYLEADLFQLKFTQSADVLYITHPTYAPRKLSRTGHTAWTLTTIDFQDGPYLPMNTGATTVTPSAATGTGITLTASAALFASTDVGRLVRIRRDATNWGWVKITAFTDTTHVTGDVVGGDVGTGAVTSWRLGVWSGTTGYPAASVFHEDRLWFAGCTSYPERLDGSNTSDYENFAPTDLASTVIASNGISISLNANDVNVIRCLSSDEKGLLVFTVGGEWVIRPSNQNEAISPTNVNAKRATAYGSEDIAAMQLGKAALFVQRSGRKIRELNYFFDVDGFRATDLTVLAEHILDAGVVELATTEIPHPVLWAVRKDGTLAGMTYDRDVDNLKAAWHRHQLGGYGDVAANPPYVESACAIPSSDGTYSELWLLVRRLVNGTSKRYVEYLTPFFDDTIDQSHGYHVDCGLTYDAPVAITDASIANPFVVTAPSHGFSDGDQVRFDDLVGLTSLDATVAPLGKSFLNGTVYEVTNSATNSFRLKDTITGVAVSIPIGYSPYLSGGKVRKLVSTISGLDHLEQELIDVMGDGADYGQIQVSSGAITLPTPAAVVHAGYAYNSDAQLLRFEAGSADGTALGKKKRTHMMRFYLYRTLGLKFGMSFSKLQSIVFRKTGDQANSPPPLFSGITDPQRPEAGYDTENQICLRQDRPFPGIIQAVLPQLMTQDDG